MQVANHATVQHDNRNYSNISSSIPLKIVYKSLHT